MNKFVKITLLFTALLLPALVFVFLKMFGENKFDIPVFNHTEMSSEIECDNIVTPHVVGELIIDDKSIHSNRTANIYHIFDSVVNQEEMRGLMKVKDRLENEQVAISSIGKLDSSLTLMGLSKKYQIGGVWQMHLIKENNLDNFVNCELMITGEHSMVLTDKEGRIRGYYQGMDKDETDRLILESKILLYSNGE